MKNKQFNKLINKIEDDKLLQIIKEDFDCFFKEKGYYPTTQEIDNSGYMTSSRTMQRRYGGVKEVRKILGLPITDYTRGESRSEMTRMCFERGISTEGKTEDILKEYFPIQTIHRQAVYAEKYRCDFLVYNKTNNLYIDVFYTEKIDNFNSIINIKLNKYSVLKDNPILLVVDGLNGEDIKEKIKYKKRYIPDNFKIISIDELSTEIKNYTPYTVL